MRSHVNANLRREELGRGGAVVGLTMRVVVSAHALSPVAAGPTPRALGAVVSVVTMRIHASRAGSAPTSWQLAGSVCSGTTVKATGEPETARPFSRTLTVAVARGFLDPPAEPPEQPPEPGADSPSRDALVFGREARHDAALPLRCWRLVKVRL
jgi:hypothetical protein